MLDTELYLLKDAEAKYRGMFENAVEGIYQSTPDGQFLAVNTALARMYGYERSEESSTKYCLAGTNAFWSSTMNFPC
jgi:PAS domain-containing protein